MHLFSVIYTYMLVYTQSFAILAYTFGGKAEHLASTVLRFDVQKSTCDNYWPHSAKKVQTMYTQHFGGSSGKTVASGFGVRAPATQSPCFYHIKLLQGTSEGFSLNKPM